MIIKRLFFVLFNITTLVSIGAQENPAYRLYRADGTPLIYGDMLRDLSKSDVVFFGEFHDNPICHWLQKELLKSLHGKRKRLTIGFEMFEADNQLILDEYMAGLITKKSFKSEARLWPNYKTDYEPLIEFGIEHKLNIVATNVPRRYANLVYREGLNALNDLSDVAKSYMTSLPMPFEPDSLKSYQDMLLMSESNENFPAAQALKDATMAHFILKNLSIKGLFIHFNGSFHSNHREGIVWYLHRWRPKLAVQVIATVEQDDVTKLEDDNKGLGDFILVVPESMTKTY